MLLMQLSRFNFIKFKSSSALAILFNPQSRVLLEKLTGSQLVKKFSAFYGSRRFVTTFTSVHHLSLY
jgi:hypothetical protein